MGSKRDIKKRCVALLMIVLMAYSLAGCGKSRETIKLSVWTTEAKLKLMESSLDAFKKLHEDEVNIEYVISKEDEDTCKETILSNPEGAADIFAFADDQLDELKDAGVLYELSADPEKDLEPFGGKDSVAYRSVVRDGKMYAYPETANGYFMYYNKKFFKAEDVKSLDRMVEIAGNDNKRVAMDLSSGWYLYSFFKGAGLTLELDGSGKKNVCNWNAKDTKHTGLEVAEAISRLSIKRGFKSMADDDFIKGVQNGTVVAGVNGAWNAEKVMRTWGVNYAAVKLPTYRVGGEDVQMASYTGYKVIGINANSAHAQWCETFVEYYTSAENQIEEFKETGEVPANLNVADSEVVSGAAAVMALGEQSKYAELQRVAPPFWDAASKFGVTLGSGNPDKRDLQELLDEMVKGITE